MRRERVFKNTFEPACKDREVRVSGIVAGLRFGAFKYSRLPPEVRKAVDEEVERMASEARGLDEKDDWKLNMLDLKIRATQRVVSPRPRTKLWTVRVPSVPMPLDLLAGSVQRQKMDVGQYVGQCVLPNETRRIAALVESR